MITYEIERRQYLMEGLGLLVSWDQQILVKALQEMMVFMLEVTQRTLPTFEGKQGLLIKNVRFTKKKLNFLSQVDL